MKSNIWHAFVLAAAFMGCQSVMPAMAGTPDAGGGDARISFGDGRVAELYSGRRLSAKEDQRDWLVVRLGEVGMVVVGSDGKTEVMAIDKFGGIYINGDLYLRGKKLVPAREITPQPPPQQEGFGKWIVLLLFVLSVITSVAISLGTRRA